MAEAKQDLPFDLTLTDDQRITRETMERFAESEMRSISRDADEAAAAPEGFYDKVIELGVNMMSIPEEFGGGGAPRSPVSNMLIAEDLGKGDFSLALGALAPLGVANVIMDQGSAKQKEKWLPKFTEETFYPAAIALVEPRATFDAQDIHTTATASGDGYVLNGVKALVPHGAEAELLMVIANLEGKPAAFLVEKGAAGLSAESQEAMGLRPLSKAKITLEEVKVGADALLGEKEIEFDYQRLVDLSRLGVCAASIGVCQAVLDYVVDYTNTRVAFGEPISHRQAVAFMVANIAIELEGMRLLVYRAVSKAEQGLDFHKEAFLAHSFASERTMEIGTNGVQLLGGHGFIREHMVELWYRNLRSVAILEGTFHL